MASHRGWVFALPLCLCLCLCFLQRAAALSFNAVGGPFTSGAQVALSWTLDGTEPDAGWGLWFSNKNGTLSGDLGTIAPGQLSALVVFPGVDGFFQGRDASNTVIATSAEVDLLAASGSGGVLAGQTGSADKINGMKTMTASSKQSSGTNMIGPIIGVALAILVLLVLIVVGAMFFITQRRKRRVAHDAEISYPFGPTKKLDLSAELTEKYTAYHSPSSFSATSSRNYTPSLPETRPLTPQRGPPRGPSIAQMHFAKHGAPRLSVPHAPIRSISPPIPVRPPSLQLAELPRQPQSAALNDSRRTAYLNSQLEKLSTLREIDRDPQLESASVVFGPLSSVPSESTTGGNRFSFVQTQAHIDASKRTQYLSQQLARLDNAHQSGRPDDDGSVAFSPLSRVPSIRTDAVVSPAGTQPPVRSVAGSGVSRNIINAQEPNPYRPLW